MKVCQVKTDNGTVLNAVYAVKSIKHVAASHYVNGSSMCTNPEYPDGLQPRNRSAIMMVAQISKMAQTLRPDELTASVFLNQGAPIIREDGIVLNGNGRLIAISYAYRTDLPSAAKYRKYIVDHAADFGLTANEISSIAQPILVREIVDEIDDGLIDEIIHSTVGGSSMSAFEQAKIDASRLTIADFADYDEESNGDLTSIRNQSFVGTIIWRLAKDVERNQYFNAQGKLTKNAVDRARNAIFALAYHDDGMLDKMTLSNDEGAQNISKAMIIAAPKFAKLTLQQRDGVFFDYDTASILSRAIDRYNYVRESKKEWKSIEQFVEENEGALVDPEPQSVKSLMLFFSRNKRSQKNITNLLKGIIKVIKQQGSPCQETLAGFEHDPLDIDGVIDQAIKITDSAINGGMELFIEEPQTVKPAESFNVLEHVETPVDYVMGNTNETTTEFYQVEQSAGTVDIIGHSTVKSAVITPSDVLMNIRENDLNRKAESNDAVDTNETVEMPPADNTNYSVAESDGGIVADNQYGTFGGNEYTLPAEIVIKARFEDIFIELHQMIADANLRELEARYETYEPTPKRKRADRGFSFKKAQGRGKKVNRKLKERIANINTLLDELKSIAANHVDVPVKPAAVFTPRAARANFYLQTASDDADYFIEVRESGDGRRRYFLIDETHIDGRPISPVTVKALQRRGDNIVFVDAS